MSVERHGLFELEFVLRFFGIEGIKGHDSSLYDWPKLTLITNVKVSLWQQQQRIILLLLLIHHLEWSPCQ